MLIDLSTNVSKLPDLSYLVFQEEEGEEAMRKGRCIDFLDILLTARDEEGKGLDFLEIRDEVDTFMFEGQKKFLHFLTLLIWVYSFSSSFLLSAFFRSRHDC